MVGIPGRSRGCHSCRRRKVKCDEGRPTCQRCAKSGRECEGYEKAPVFLNRTARGLEKRRHLDEARMPQDRLTVSVSPGPSMARSRRPSVSPQPSSSPDFVPPSPATQRLSGAELSGTALPRRPSDMELTAGEVRSTLIEQYFPAADSGAAAFAEWLLYTLDLSPWGELLETALLALTMARVGKVQNNSKMNLQGRLKYGKALNLLQQALLDSPQSMEDQTLAACNVLKFYEVCEATENTVQSFHSHVHGIVRLLIHRGSERNDSDFARALINDVRYGAMLVAINNRKRDPMGDKLWRKEHWESAADVEQGLYDRGFDIAAITEDLDQQLTTSAQSADYIQAYLTRALNIAKDLKLWYASASAFLHWDHQWASPLPTSPEDESSSATTGKSKSPPVPPVDLDRLRESLLTTDFWALLISISVILQSLAVQLSVDSSGAASLLRDANAYGSALQLRLASNILGQIPYQVQPDHGLKASERAIFSLLAARHPASAYPTDEARQILEAVESAIGWIAEGRGLRHARVVLEAAQEWGDLGS